MLTVVMYQDLPHTGLPAIKGMGLEHFEGQLAYLTKHHHICDMREILAAHRGEDMDTTIRGWTRCRRRRRRRKSGERPRSSAPLAIPRLDATDLPTAPDAGESHWTARICGD